MADSVTLVTGASGFLGKAVMELLGEQKQRAIGLDPRSSATTQIVDDLSDCSKLARLLKNEKVTHIIHAGGVSGPMVLADDPLKVMHMHVSAEPPRPSSLRPDLPENLERLILACLAKQPVRRPASAQDLHGALLRIRLPEE